MQELHVLHVIDGLALGGAERMLVDLANATVRDGHRVSVCITRSDTTLARELDPAIAILVLGRRSKVSLAASRQLASWVRSRGVDVLHVHMRSSAAFMVLLRALRVIRVPLVFHDHYGTIEIDTTVPLWFRFGHRLIDHYVGVYDKLCTWAQGAGMPPSKTTTITNTLDLSRVSEATQLDIRAELGISNTDFVGVIVASLRRDKGLETLIDAVGLSRYRERLRVLVVGSPVEADYAEECRQRVSAVHLDGTIMFLGGRTDVPRLLPASDIGLLSSHTESGPLVLIEYLAAGLPFVATRVGDIGKRLASLGVPGFVSPRDPAAFAQALDELLDLSMDERARRGALGRRIMTDTWDVRSTMPRWYEVYRSVLAH